MPKPKRRSHFVGVGRGRGCGEQYAENNAGVCLVFDRERLVDAILGSLEGRELAALYHQEVTYEGGGILKPILDIEALGEKVTPARVNRFIEEHYEPLFFQKVLDWQSEHEYRFCTIAGDGDEVFANIEEALHAVIVGERFPKWQRPAVIEACIVAHAQPLRLDWSHGEPSLRPLKPIHSRRDEIREAIEDSPGPGPPAAPPAGHGGS